MGKGRKAVKPVAEQIPRWSPRHPANMQETQRVLDIIASETRERERGALVRQNRANERPAGGDWYMPVNPSSPDSKRFYVPAPGPNHVLTRAFQKKKLTLDQYRAANDYRLICKSAFEVAAGRDSTQAMNIQGGKPNYEAAIDISFGDVESRIHLGQIHAELGKESAAIIFLICGHGHEVGDTIRAVTPKVHPNGVWGRFEEAIDALHAAINPRQERKRA